MLQHKRCFNVEYRRASHAGLHYFYEFFRFDAPAATRARDSANAWTSSAYRRFIASLIVWPAPLGPSRKNFLPMASSAGFTRSYTALSPPIMNTSSPFSAPQVPPVTGASRKSTPRSLQAPASFRASSGDTVLESTSTLPFRRAANAPSLKRTSSTAGGSLTIVIKTSLRSATSRGFAASFAPPRTKSSALEAVRFQMVRGNPAFNRFWAIGFPIRPSPIKPIDIFIVHLPLESITGTAAWWRASSRKLGAPRAVE